MKRALCALALVLGLGCTPAGSPSWKTVDGTIAGKLPDAESTEAVVYSPGFEIPKSKYFLDVDGSDDLIIRYIGDLETGQKVRVKLGACYNKVGFSVLDWQTMRLETLEYWLCSARTLEKQ